MVVKFLKFVSPIKYIIYYGGCTSNPDKAAIN